ncbi:MAG: hypothetical protein NVSMB9_08380 [Isosphaeraceae bacterium]
MDRRLARLVVLTLIGMAATTRQARAERPGDLIDLSGAAVVTRADPSGIEKKAAELLRGMVEEHTGLRWEVGPGRPEGRGPWVAIGLRSSAKDWAGPLAGRVEQGREPEAAEGFQIVSDPSIRGVAVAGVDLRGVLFGVGRLLRELRMSKGTVLLPGSFHLTSAPRVALRGHQLGYRPKTNSYDAWDLPQWERYIRDLAIFGTNAVELVPPTTDDDAESPHFPRPPLEMMVGMSRLLDEHGLDVWVWFPAMVKEDADSSQFEASLKEWETIFRKLPRLDAVFVPGGDPGHLRPRVLLPFLEKVARLLRKTHPRAALWVSPQGFNQVWMDEFLGILKADEPAWLSGVVFGPQVRLPLAELRRAIPARYPIRGYPDITHSRQCQHPVPDWDLAFAVTEGREAINPRPRAQAAIFQKYRESTVGFISYSEGCNDDVNKMVWSALGWNPEEDVVEILRQYSRVFLGERLSEDFAQALLALERNWSGPLLTNAGVETTLKQLQDIERKADPKTLRNWRWQQALYRGFYDAHVRDRLIQETALDTQAMDALRQAPTIGSEPALSRATRILDRTFSEPVSVDRRARVFELAEALFQSIGMQLSVARYRAIEAERGANLDTIDVPLNNRVWLAREFSKIRALATEPERLEALDVLLKRTDPGPGGFYDNPGDPSHSPHLVREPSVVEDPILARAAFHGFALRPEWPLTWRRYAQTFYDAPLRFRYDGLDPGSRYRLRVVYAGDSPRARMHLEAEGVEVHPWLAKPDPVGPLEFDVPRKTIADGRLELSWRQEQGRGGNGRGCQVAEVWLIRVSP